MSSASCACQGLPVPPHIDAAARTHRYNRHVFIAPYWDAIYTADAERKQTPAVAEATHAVMAETYRDYGYELIELPRVSVVERVTYRHGPHRLKPANRLVTLAPSAPVA